MGRAGRWKRKTLILVQIVEPSPGPQPVDAKARVDIGVSLRSERALAIKPGLLPALNRRAHGRVQARMRNCHEPMINVVRARSKGIAAARSG